MGHVFAAVAAAVISPVCSEAECGVKCQILREPRQGRHKAEKSFKTYSEACFAPAGAPYFHILLPRIPLSHHTGLITAAATAAKTVAILWKRYGHIIKIVSMSKIESF